MQPLFIGFRVKTVPLAMELSLLRNSLVKHQRAEVCSISDCVAKPPPDWVDRWDFNHTTCYNSQATAEATIPPGEEAKYNLFAYRMFPTEFNKTGVRTLELPDALDKGLQPIGPEPDLTSFASIGYDVAGQDLPGPGYRAILGFACSPLSCNCMSSEYPVNRFWLIDNLEQAMQVATDFARTEPEPGPYYIYEVLRKRSPHWQPD